MPAVCGSLSFFQSFSVVNLLGKDVCVNEKRSERAGNVSLKQVVLFLVLWRPPEVRNGVGSAEELYGDSYDYYANQGISQ